MTFAASEADQKSSKPPASPDVSPADAPLHVHDVLKYFFQGENRIAALDGVNLTVGKGEFIAIMGASGSGKSTLLHAMAGLIDLDGGTVTVDGQDLSKLTDARLTRFRGQNIGMVFQSFNLIPSLTAESNVRLPAKDDSSLNDRIAALFDRLGMTERRLHKPNALSGGEQQRIAIARALICDPAILLADEPTGSLDSVTGQEICQLLRELCDEQERTIVVVTHEPQVAMWADRVVVLKDGRNRAEFEARDVKDPQQVSLQYQSLLSAEAESCGR